MSLSAAADELGVALESTLLAERELASGRLVQPLKSVAQDVTYTGHWLVFPRAKRYSRPLLTFVGWIQRELALDIDLALTDPESVAPDT